MDKLPELGRIIPDTVGPTYEIYGDLLRKDDNASAIRSTSRHEFQYGAQDRQKLDLYTPSQASTHGKNPVLMFFYGGGFISGDKRLKAIPDDVAYTNLGHFFADKLGFDTVVVDYRLIGHGAKYPSGPEDVDLALQWVEKRFTDRDTLYLLGNSAGGVHVVSWLFGRSFTEHRDQLIGVKSSGSSLKIQAVGLLGAPFRLDPEGAMKPLLSAHYGEPEFIRAEEPQQLMLNTTEHLSREEIGRWPRLSVLVCELDPESDIRQAGKNFADLWQSRGGRGNFVDIPGHNHISPVLSLGTALEKEEAWGYEFGRWLA